VTSTLALATRPATGADDGFLRGLFVSTRPFDTSVLAAVPGLLELQHDARERAYAAAYPSTRDEIVLLDDVPVGRLLTAPLADGSHLVDIALVPRHQSRGLGTLLLGRLLAAGPVTLRVDATNPARRLYERLGFTTVSATATDLSLHHPGHDTNEGAGA
jgi:ribosomal protein S18 acetylase RimI-like enzyme